MTYAYQGTLGTKPCKRDEIVALLTRRSTELADAGCLLYEVGVNEDEPDSVFVSELWVSAEAHHDSLQLDSVRATIGEAMPLLSGQNDSTSFTVVGSPLRD